MNNDRNFMPQPTAASHHHGNAAFHHESAAMHHRQAATHREAGRHDEADRHDDAARMHGRIAQDHADAAAQHAHESRYSLAHERREEGHVLPRGRYSPDRQEGSNLDFYGRVSRSM